MQRISEKLLYQCPLCCRILCRDSDFQLWQDGNKFFAVCNDWDCGMKVELQNVSNKMPKIEIFEAAKKEMIELGRNSQLSRLAIEKARINLEEKTVRPDLIKRLLYCFRC